MSCFSCFSSHEKRASKRFDSARQPWLAPSPDHKGRELNKRSEKYQSQSTRQNTKSKPELETTGNKEACNGNIVAQTFTFRELASATKNFRADNLLGEGGFGRVYKGYLDKAGHLVAVKQLDRSGLQGNKEFLVEVLMLSLLHHQNLVNLIGYCADGAQRLLVYEFMPLGSLEDHLLDIPPYQKPLSWYNRMKIALGAAKGLEYLHEKANPPIIFRDLKSSNILLNENYEAKLSDFGLAKLGPVEDKPHGSSRVMGTYGYCAPEYASFGQLTLKSDVFSFGVVLLELITGRRAIDSTKPNDEQNLVSWAQPLFKDRRRYCELADPLLEGDYPEMGLNEAVAVSAMCVQEEATVRPFMTDIVETLRSHLASSTERRDSSSCTGSHHRPSSKSSSIEQAEDGGCVLDANGKVIDLWRQRAVAEAILWGSEFKAHREKPP